MEENTGGGSALKQNDADSSGGRDADSSGGRDADSSGGRDDDPGGSDRHQSNSYGAESSAAQVVEALRVVWHNADCADLMDDASDLMKSIVLDHKQVPRAKAAGILTEYMHEDAFDEASIDGKTVLQALSQLDAETVETSPTVGSGNTVEQHAETVSRSVGGKPTLLQQGSPAKSIHALPGKSETALAVSYKIFKLLVEFSNAREPFLPRIPFWPSVELLRIETAGMESEERLAQQCLDDLRSRIEERLAECHRWTDEVAHQSLCDLIEEDVPPFFLPPVSDALEKITSPICSVSDMLRTVHYAIDKIATASRKKSVPTTKWLAMFALELLQVTGSSFGRGKLLTLSGLPAIFSSQNRYTLKEGGGGP